MRSGALVLGLLGVAALAACAAPSGPPRASVTEVGVVVENSVELVSVEGVVEGVAEAGGTCRFTFWAENGAASQLTGTGRSAGDRTLCGPLAEEAHWILPAGRYEVELRYDSATVSTRSDRVEFVLP